MKQWNDAAQAAIEAGNAVSHGAVYVGTSPDPGAYWGGFGDITLPDEVTYVGIGDRGLITAASGQLGTASQPITLTLSAVEPAVAALFTESGLRGAEVRIWRLVCDTAGRFLDAQLFSQGEVDTLSRDLAEDGTFTITIQVETASRSNSRSGGRLAAGADQHLVDDTDTCLDAVSSAAQVTLYWGGKKPATAISALGVAQTSGQGVFQ